MALRVPQWLLDLLAWAFGGSSPPPAPPPPPGDDGPPSSTPTYALELLRLHNEARRGRTPLKLSARLVDCAVKYAKLMAERRQMGHSVDGTSFVQRAKSAGYPNPGAENVAMGYVTPQAVHDGWMGSAGHRANILGPYVDVGFGMAVDSRGRNYWCAVFGWGAQQIVESFVEVEPLIHPNLKVKRVERFLRSAPPHGKRVVVYEEQFG